MADLSVEEVYRATLEFVKHWKITHDYSALPGSSHSGVDLGEKRAQTCFVGHRFFSFHHEKRRISKSGPRLLPDHGCHGFHFAAIFEDLNFFVKFSKGVPGKHYG
jgi:hypothetical protein